MTQSAPPKLTARCDKGYTRDLGWKLNADDRRVQHRFLLGRDLRKAQRAVLLLEQLWEEVVAHAEQADREPLWDARTLAMADALRKGEAFKVAATDLNGPLDEPVWTPGQYAQRVDELRSRHKAVAVVPDDLETFRRGQTELADVAQALASFARQVSTTANVPPPVTTNQSLYVALDAYADQVLANNKRESGKVEAAAARRLKNSLGDMDLGEFGYSALEKLRNYWSARPAARSRGGKSKGNPISLHTVTHHLKTTRRFVAWLDRSEAFDWQMPRHGLDALKVNLKRLQTDGEVAAKRHGVSVFTVAHLATIYQHATNTQRLLMLLGLNAAMSHAEIITLRWDEIDDATLKRIRRKSGVYAEFALWPETLVALKWWKWTAKPRSQLVMLTERGNPYTRQLIANSWQSLFQRVARVTGHEPTWWLPFKHLRKTAAQMVREASDGEVAGVFLSHGKPVATDELADVYSNRPFGKVTKALAKARVSLEPAFAACPDAFAIGGRG